MFKNILVPIDGSEYSLNAAKTAISIGEKFEGKVTFLHVISKSLETTPNIKEHKATLVEEIETLRAQGYKILEKAIQSTGKDTAEIEAVLSWGNPADIIMEEIGEKEYDLVVMGSRGLGAIKGLLLGSVSERVVRLIKCPVMIIKDFYA